MEYDFLEHFGVKGMRWGQRKIPLSADEARLRYIDKQLPKYDRERNLLRRTLPSEASLGGYGSRAQAAKHVLKLKRIDGLEGSKLLVPTDKTREIEKRFSAEVLDRKITRRAIVTHVATGTLVVSALLASAAIANARPDKSSKQVAIGLAGLAALQATHSMSATLGIAAVHIDASRDLKAKNLKTERRVIQKRIDKTQVGGING